MEPELATTSRKIYTVSQVTRDLKNLVEENFFSVWIKGEVSNFKAYASGHYYFTIKELDSQINAVMFKGYNRKLKFNLEDGMNIILHGRISIYEPRGQYQIIADHIEPDGIGALQLAFEQLKSKLKDEGLFDEERKRALPFLPKTVGVVTSLHGAVIHDIMNVLRRRYPNINILIYPVKVQGMGAPEEITHAVQYFSKNKVADVLIVGRGGGSMEDLWAFNDENVVRAIANCSIPVISAVGHETDFTLSDFAADVRAPTPSAAAELTIAPKADLENTITQLVARLYSHCQHDIKNRKKDLAHQIKILPTPQNILDSLILKWDDLQDRMIQNLLMTVREKQFELTQLKLKLPNPSNQIQTHLQAVLEKQKDLANAFKLSLSQAQNKIEQNQIKLTLLNPRNTLARGYVIVRRNDGTVITRAKQLFPGDEIQLIFEDGEVTAIVEKA